jgi:hypothetical protein
MKVSYDYGEGRQSRSLQRRRDCGTITGSGVPPSAISIYHPAELLVFAASGLAIAAAGALLPANWTAAG